jgi:hypothetical protein
MEISAFRGVILGLRWGDIDFTRVSLSVRQSLEETKEGLAFKAPKTEGKLTMYH